MLFWIRAAAVAFALLLVGPTACARAVVVEGPPAMAPAPAPGPRYESAQAWLCRPDLPDDPCRTDLDATELRPDGTHVAVPFVAAAHPLADCFYVYPTVDMATNAGNHDDFADTTRMREAVRAQVARFGSVCRVFAPLYRQMTIGTYVAPAQEHERRFAVAFGDVLAAFRYYLAHFDDGRGIVLVGHSQGAQMVERLLQTLFDDDPAMRARLVVAMPIGGDVDVAEGSTRGGTFHNIPLCTSLDEPGCVVAYATYSPDGLKHPWPGTPAPGRRTACVNPAAPGGTAKARLSGTAFPTHSQYRDNMPGGWASTPFLVMRDYYSAWCVDRTDGFSYLAVTPDPAPGDVRPRPIDLDAGVWRQQLGRVQLGLHILDFQFTQDDLVNLVGRKARVLASSRRPLVAPP
jgi:Protein of unknown function (DUF3089)